MNRISRLLPTCALLLATVGCGHGAIDGLRSSEQLALYSIDGTGKPLTDETKAAETFGGYPVLGKVEIKTGDARKQLIAALKDAIEKGKGLPLPKCFWPRQALRAIEDGKTIDYVICFECSQFTVIIDGKRSPTRPLDPSVQPTFDKPLNDAGIPLAP